MARDAQIAEPARGSLPGAGPVHRALDHRRGRRTSSTPAGAPSARRRAPGWPRRSGTSTLAVDQGRDDPVRALREAQQAGAAGPVARCDLAQDGRLRWSGRRLRRRSGGGFGGGFAGAARRGGVDLGSLVLGGILLGGLGGGGGGGAGGFGGGDPAAASVAAARWRRSAGRRRASDGPRREALGTVGPRWDVALLTHEGGAMPTRDTPWPERHPVLGRLRRSRSRRHEGLLRVAARLGVHRR